MKREELGKEGMVKKEEEEYVDAIGVGGDKKARGRIERRKS